MNNGDQNHQHFEQRRPKSSTFWTTETKIIKILNKGDQNHQQLKDWSTGRRLLKNRFFSKRKFILSRIHLPRGTGPLPRNWLRRRSRSRRRRSRWRSAGGRRAAGRSKSPASRRRPAAPPVRNRYRLRPLAIRIRTWHRRIRPVRSRLRPRQWRQRRGERKEGQPQGKKKLMVSILQEKSLLPK